MKTALASYSNISTDIDNRTRADVDGYLEARVDALKREIERLNAELKRKDAVIRCREWMLCEDADLIRVQKAEIDFLKAELKERDSK